MKDMIRTIVATAACSLLLAACGKHGEGARFDGTEYTEEWYVYNDLPGTIEIEYRYAESGGTDHTVRCTLKPGMYLTGSETIDPADPSYPDRLTAFIYSDSLTLRLLYNGEEYDYDRYNERMGIYNLELYNMTVLKDEKYYGRYRYVLHLDEDVLGTINGPE